MSFAAQLASERLARGLSKRALALRAGVSPAYVTLLEQGRRRPTRAMARALGGALASTPRPAGASADPDPSARLLSAAGYSSAADAEATGHGAGSVPRHGEPGRATAPFRSPAALAAALADRDVPLSARRLLDALICDAVDALRRSAQRGERLPAGAWRTAILARLVRHEEESVRRAIEDYRSPMYDL